MDGRNGKVLGRKLLDVDTAEPVCGAAAGTEALRDGQRARAGQAVDVTLADAEELSDLGGAQKRP
jgi:hypothetical protein